MNRAVRGVSLFSGARNRITRALLTGELFLAEPASGRGATASSSTLVFAALSALGASAYRLWTSTELRNQRLALGRALSQRLLDELRSIKAVYARPSERISFLAELPVSIGERNNGLHSRITR